MNASEFNQLFYEKWDEAGQPDVVAAVIDTDGNTYKIIDVGVDVDHEQGAHTVLIRVEEN